MRVCAPLRRQNSPMIQSVKSRRVKAFTSSHIVSWSVCDGMEIGSGKLPTTTAPTTDCEQTYARHRVDRFAAQTIHFIILRFPVQKFPNYDRNIVRSASRTVARPVVGHAGDAFAKLAYYVGNFVLRTENAFVACVLSGSRRHLCGRRTHSER